VADSLAKHFTVIAPDLRGYGDSDKPAISDNNRAYSKRVMAKDQRDLMVSLGFDHFCILAHDRGARVAHRLSLDYPAIVTKMVLLDIAPTLAMYEQTDQAFARAYWHWFFLIRPSPLPEILIESDPYRYLKGVMAGRSAGMTPFTEEAFNEYLRCLKLPGTATGICEDYRASAGIDLEHDRQDIEAGNKIACPLLVLWGRNGAVARSFDPLREWKMVAVSVEGTALPCGHYIPEEAPDLLFKKVSHFFKLV